MNLRQLIAAASSIGLIAEPFKCEIDQVDLSVGPSILHWEFKHFVVLLRRRGKRFEIFDPAIGRRVVDDAELSNSYTGVALQITRGAEFGEITPPRRSQVSALWRGSPGLLRALASAGALSFCLEVCILLIPLFLQFVIDDVVSPSDIDVLAIFAFGFSIVVLMQGTLIAFRGWSLQLLTQSVAVRWATLTFSHLLKLPAEYFERRRLGDLVSRFGSLGSIQQAVTVSALEAAMDSLLAVASLLVMLVYSPQLTMIALFALVVQSLIRLSTYGALENVSKERIVASSRENTVFLETLRAILPIRLHGAEFERRRAWQALRRSVQVLDLRKGKYEVLVAASLSVVAGLENIATIWYGVYLAVTPGGAAQLSIGMLMVFIAYKTQFLVRINNILKLFVDFRMVRLHAERLDDIIGEPIENDVPDADCSHLAASIQFVNVGFRYNKTDPWLFRDVSFTIEPGKVVAICGPSGGGKTTLVKLMLGVLRPEEGEILFGGVKLNALGMNNFRKLIGSVMQEDVLLCGSVAENISFFNSDVGHEEIVRSSRAANVYAEVMRMPMGLNTLIGDLGSGLSGGQKQRVLLARAICRQPKVLILDEATSHLDSANERAVNGALLALGMTRIFVAHRETTIACAEQLIEVDGGMVRMRDFDGRASAKADFTDQVGRGLEPGI